MADLGASSWSETDASNNATPPAGWPEGMNPSDVNNSARADKGAVKRFWDRINAIKATAGTSTAYTLTYDVAAAAYYDGEVFSFLVNATCGAAPTLNINALGARNLRIWQQGAGFGNPVVAGDLLINQIVMARYNLAATTFDIIGNTGAVPSASATTFLTADAACVTANTFVNGPNTGSTGANGQIWQITAGGSYFNGSGGNMTGALRIFNGSTTIIDGQVALTTGFSSGLVLGPIVVSLTAATTFTLQSSDNIGGSAGILKASTTYTGGATNKATWITAVRLS